MCTYRYIHYHHTPLCHKPIDFSSHFEFCKRATKGVEGCGRQPCAKIYQQQELKIDVNNPCGTSTCMKSLKCSSGSCRLQELNGLWRCCRCRLGMNTRLWCQNVMANCPDTFCYHVICFTCTSDCTPAMSIPDNHP
jgi:hypothetical protein